MNNHVVQSRRDGDLLAVPVHPRIEQEAVLHGVLSAQNRGDLAGDLVRSDVRQEAQTTAVHAQHGYAVVGHVARNAENAAVAAHDHHEVRPFADPFARGSACTAKHPRCRRLQRHLRTGCLQCGEHRPKRVDHVRAAGSPDQRDMAECRHRVALEG